MFCQKDENDDIYIADIEDNNKSEAMMEYSEPALNVMLAELLTKQGLVGAGEVVMKGKTDIRKPDVFMLLEGVKVILEGKLPKQTARSELTNQCNHRVREGLCDVSIGVIYHLAKTDKLFTPMNELKPILKKSKYEVAIWIPGRSEPEQKINWEEVDLNGLGKIIRSAVNEVVSADLLTEVVYELNNTINEATDEIIRTLGAEDTVKNLTDKLAEIMELTRPKNAEERVRTIKMAMLVLLDASIFFNVISDKSGLSGFDKIKKKEKTWISTLKRSFEEALKIDYEPVFVLSGLILDLLPNVAENAMEKVIKTSQYIAAGKALLKHDLMGRIYHKLLFEKIAKHLATYYTSIPAAWLLARLCLDTKESLWGKLDWTDPDKIKDMKVLDMACGSGTLLSAAYRAIEDKYIIACAEKDKTIETKTLHRNLIENSIYGFDVMLYAAHIATITLALHNSETVFDKTNIYVLPIGERGDLGSINFLASGSQVLKTKITHGDEKGPVRVGVKERKIESIKLNSHMFDLIIMNPPFARSCGDNLMFGHVENARVRELMKKNLSDLLKKYGFEGIGQAGLGAIFVVLADKYVKKGGRIAFVLPRNLLSGDSWEKIRKLLSSDAEKKEWDLGGYHLEYIIVSTEANSYNFSENTDLSECLFVARKLEIEEEPGKTLLIILHKKPGNVFESLNLSKQIINIFEESQKSEVYDLFSKPNAWPQILRDNGATIAKVYSVNREIVQENSDNLGRLIAFANPEITKLAYGLRTREELHLPGKWAIDIPITELSTIAEVGPDRHQIHDSFEKVERGGIVHSVWGREMGMNCLEILPNKKLAPKPGKNINSILKSASNLMIAERVRLNTIPLIALYCTRPVLSNVWWSISSSLEKVDKGDAEKVMALWLNSTPGLLLYMSELEVTEGPWAGMKKGRLEKMPTLDLMKIGSKKVDEIADYYEEIKNEKFSLLQDQFKEATQGKGLRMALDTKLLSVISGKKILAEDLMPLYSLLEQESYHWGIYGNKDNQGIESKEY
jgi:type I restriction-modification system DNA methylase subunit